MAAPDKPPPPSPYTRLPDDDSATAVTQALTPPPASARNFHHYEVALRPDGVTLDELGRGAMGVTYKARDINLDSPVALKVIGPALSDHAGARERFRREARAAAQLRHPNVASVFHFGQTDAGQCFYAMEFIAGETLAAKVLRDGPMPAPLVVEIALQINAALIAADRRGLVHRDLKPGNLMLVAPEDTRGPAPPSRPGGSSAGQILVKVIDFGLAKAITTASAEPAEDLAPLTQGEFLGTPQFAAPEQAEGGEVDARSDIYSLGATLWYLLTAQVPFAGRSLGEIHDRQLHRPLPVGQLADARVPAPLVALLESMLAAEPSRRPASPLALEESLERVRQEIGGTAALRQLHLTHRPTPRAGWKRFALPAAVLVGLALLGLLAVRRLQRPATPSSDKSIAVLPLENLSDDKENAFFADGIQGDILASLAKIKDLKVISRSSVTAYKAGDARNLREIGNALDVSNVLTGSVRRAGNRVLVNVELVRTADGRQLWSERYDRTLADSLTLQGELATEIAAALRTTLSPAERAQMAAKPTEDADAYLLYLRGREAQTTSAGLQEDYLRAARLYEQAIARDPGFALARARLSATLAFLYQQYQPTALNRDRARAEADAALRLRPDLGEGHLARALCLYWLDKGYDAALAELDLARRVLPNDSDVDATAAYITRRRGRWNEARDAFHRILARDPHNGQLTEELCFTDVHLRDWPAAIRSGDISVVLAPDSPSVVIYRRYIDFWSRGDLAPLTAVLATFPPGVDPDAVVTSARLDVALIERDWPAAERAVAACALDPVPQNLGAPLPKDYLLGSIALARGDAARAKLCFERALPTFEAEVRASPEAAYRHARLGLLLAYLGRKEDALREGRRAVELLPEATDALDGPQATSFLALILTRCGEHDEALPLLERLLRVPGPPDPYEASVTLADLRAHWQWDPLRADPRFQRILTGPEPETVFR